MIRIILAISVMVVGVLSWDMKPTPIHYMNHNSKPNKWGGPMVQMLTPSLTNFADGIFYQKCKLLFNDRDTAERFYMEFENGTIKPLCVNATGIEGDKLAFAYPMKVYKYKKVVGAGNSILSSEYNPDDHTYKYSPPIQISKDKGYEICKAHADSNGVLYISLNSPADYKHRGGQLYKVVEHVPIEVKQYDHNIGDFTWSEDYKNMYLIGDNGRTISKYDYSKETSNLQISSEQVFFKIPNDIPKKHLMTGIDMDKEGCLWVTLTNCGTILQIDSSGMVKQIIGMPVSQLTGLTIGGKGLLVTTSKRCGYPEYGSGSILYVSGINATGIPDNSVSF